MEVLKHIKKMYNTAPGSGHTHRVLKKLIVKPVNN